MFPGEQKIDYIDSPQSPNEFHYPYIRPANGTVRPFWQKSGGFATEQGAGIFETRNIRSKSKRNMQALIKVDALI
jgi:hypothetical protein